MKPIVLREFDPYIEALGLKWQVSYIVDPTAPTCRILSDGKDMRHTVRLTAYAAVAVERYVPDIVHELCHAHLAETVDPAFASVFYSRQSISQAMTIFANKAKMVYWSVAHMDIWVDDIRHARWPNFTSKDLNYFGERVNALARNGSWRAISVPEIILGIAVTLAESKRFGIPAPDLSFPIAGLEEKYGNVLAKLRVFYENLPALPKDRAEALRILEESVAAVAQIIRVPFIPRLVREQGLHVWDV
jgi:hypothetical protein